MISHTDEFFDTHGTLHECISAADQEWDAATIAQLWREHNIIFDPHGILPVKVVCGGSENKLPLICLGTEDDGTIRFELDALGDADDYQVLGYRNMFDAFWIDSIISQLQQVKQKLNTKREIMAMSDEEWSKV